MSLIESDPSRILVLDSQRFILDLYREILCPEGHHRSPSYESPTSQAHAEETSGARSPVFELILCRQDEEAVAAVRESIDKNTPFSVAFLDVQATPVTDGIWVPEHIRNLDPYVEIVIVTAQFQMHPGNIASRIPPVHKLLYLQKPFYPQEIYQFACALSTKWRVEKELREIHGQLEQRVRERTAELVTVSTQLQEEILKYEQAEKALSQSQQMLRLILDSIPIRVFWKDRNSVYLGCNPGFARDAGLRSSEEIVGKTDYDLAWNREEADSFRRYDRKVMETDTPDYRIFQPQRQVSGKQIWLHVKKVPLHDAVGNVVGVLGTSEDITERLRAEEALRQSEMEHRLLVKNLPNIVFKGYRDGAIDLFDNKIQSLTGYSKEDFDSRKMKWFDIVVPEDVEPMREVFKKALKASKSYVREYRIKTKMGNIVWLQEGSQIICDENGKIDFITGALLNITERKVAEEKIRKLNEELEQRIAERTAELRESLDILQGAQAQLVQSEKMAALGSLVAGVAHEINTPLGIGVTAASFLDEKTREFRDIMASGSLKRSDLESYTKTTIDSTGMILSNLRRAANLIQRFKQVAVDQSSEERRTFRLREYIEDVLLSLQPKLKKTDHRVIVRCPEDLELYSYPGAFSQVITNLVTNSLIHGFEDKERGEIVLEVTKEEKTIRFKYHDDGKGMDGEEIRKIFDPFFTTKRGRGGTGLGMHIVYNLVTQTLGGQIMCTSAPEQGITFVIRIPLEREEGNVEQRR